MNWTLGKRITERNPIKFYIIVEFMKILAFHWEIPEKFFKKISKEIPNEIFEKIVGEKSDWILVGIFNAILGSNPYKKLLLKLLKKNNFDYNSEILNLLESFCLQQQCPLASVSYGNATEDVYVVQLLIGEKVNKRDLSILYKSFWKVTREIFGVITCGNIWKFWRT